MTMDDMADVQRLATIVAKAIETATKPLHTRLAAVERRQHDTSGPSVKWAGIFAAGMGYDEGALVTHDGSLWLCVRSNVDVRPGKDSQLWRLICKGR